MELSTTQIIAAVVILAFMAVTVCLAYWAGHTEGSKGEYQHGRIQRGIELQAERLRIEEELAETQRLLDCRNREIRTLRDNIRIEADDNAAVIRELHDRLTSTQPLTEEDRATLHGIAAKLTIAANTFAGVRAHDHARLARSFAAYATEMANRPAPALQRHPDTELIEWLDREASFNADFECAELRFMVTTSPEGHDHIRDVIRRAMNQAEEIEQGHQATLEASA